MPELPEVETVARDLRAFVRGQTINSVKVHDDRVIKYFSARQFSSQLKNKTIKDVTRRAKAIIMAFEEGGFLVVQLKMTGFFLCGDRWLADYHPRDVKVSFTLSGGENLHYLDQRTFGWLILTDDLNSVPYLTTAGPEPLSRAFNPEKFSSVIQHRSAPIKNVLLNQNIIAGLGNIYVSEILYASKVHPSRAAGSLNEQEIRALCANTKDIISLAIKERGTSMRNYRDANGRQGKFMNRIKVYGKTGERCSRCEGVIERIVQAGRSSFFCGGCQS